MKQEKTFQNSEKYSGKVGTLDIFHLLNSCIGPGNTDRIDLLLPLRLLTFFHLLVLGDSSIRYPGKQLSLSRFSKIRTLTGISGNSVSPEWNTICVWFVSRSVITILDKSSSIPFPSLSRRTVLAQTFSLNERFPSSILDFVADRIRGGTTHFPWLQTEL